MKKPTFTLLAAFAAATAFSGNLSERLGPSASRAVPVHFAFNIPTGETLSDLDYPVLMDQVDATFLTTGRSFRMERIRELSNIPYISHRTNDAEVTGGVITEGTTFSSYGEAFVGRMSLYDGSGFSDDVGTSYVQSRYPIDEESQELRFSGNLTKDSQNRYCYPPYVAYSLASNALYYTSMRSHPEHWHYFTPGVPGKHRYVSRVHSYDPPAYGPAIVTDVGGGVLVTNMLGSVPDRNNVYSSILFAGLTMPTNLVVSTNGATQAYTFVPGHVVTNFAVWSSCSMTVTNTLVNIASCGKTFSTNLNGTAVLSRDVIRVSGTATPTCYVIGVGRK